MDKHAKWITEAVEAVAETALREDGEYWRSTYTREDDRAVALLKELMKAKGMEVCSDAVGNLFGRIPGRSQEVIMAGSHRDTVRRGGKYDGMLGVLTAIEAAGSLQEEAGIPEKTVEVVAFCEEESSRFPTSYLGSRYLCGEFSEIELADRDAEGIPLGEAMKQAGYLKESLAGKRMDLERFVELHIEQGGILEQKQKQIGIVTAIVGLFSGEVYFKGHQNHAGTTPMYMRKDPTPVAAEFIYRLNQWAMCHQYDLVCTVGKMNIKPGNANVIADEVMFTFDIRSSKAELMQEAAEVVEQLKDEMEGLIEISIVVPCNEPPVSLDEEGVALMKQIADNGNYNYMEIVSGAGHDSQVLAQSFPVNMIFVPSVQGISHNENEFTRAEDIEAGVHFLKDFLLEAAWKA